MWMVQFVVERLENMKRLALMVMFTMSFVSLAEPSRDEVGKPYRNSAGSSWTDLHEKAALSGDPSYIEELIKEKADFSATRKHGWTLLHYAAAKGDVRFMKSLLDSVADDIDINAREARLGLTPLHLADKPSVVKVLIEFGANVDAKNNHGLTPLRQSVFTKEPPVIEALIDAGADVNAMDEHGYTALDSAVKASNKGASRVLRKNGGRHGHQL